MAHQNELPLVPGNLDAPTVEIQIMTFDMLEEALGSSRRDKGKISCKVTSGPQVKIENLAATDY